MPRPDRFHYSFRPVGQGLFSVGMLYRNHWRPRPGCVRFLWIYDCGTVSSQTLIDRELEWLDRITRHRRKIDLLFLSHFDHDHISGICRLIQGRKVGILVLPYMPLAQRILIAVEEGARPGDVLMNFMLDPVGYLESQAEAQIELVLFVPGSGNEGPGLPGDEGDASFPPDPEPEPGSEDERQDEEPPEIEFEKGEPEDKEEHELLVSGGLARRRSTRATVSYLRRGSAIVVDKLWEFVPYNDDPGIEIGPKFRSLVEKHRAALLGATDHGDRDRALKSLKRSYTEHFGRSSRQKNAISLFLYSGPIYRRLPESFLHYCRAEMQGSWFDSRSPGPGEYRKCSIIYSGDGYLDTPESLKRLIQYLLPERVEHCGIFQVMHHGSSSNWHAGVAAAIHPFYSVFCSDPDRRDWGHPHAAVLRDFWIYRPVQVDEDNGFYCWGRLES